MLTPFAELDYNFFTSPASPIDDQLAGEFNHNRFT